MEPERPIERVLRAFARKRREQAGGPLALHPVNRRLLQEEVARQQQPANRKVSRWDWWTSPRLAGALAAVILIGSCGAFLLFRGSEHEAEFSIASQPMDRPAESEAVPSPPTVRPQPPPASAAPASGNERLRKGAATDDSTLAENTSARELRQQGDLAAVEAPRQVPMTAAVTAFDGTFGTSVPENRFVRTPRVPGTEPVLESFHVTQNDGKLQVIDRDGSVYEGIITGSMSNAPATVSAPPTRAEADAITRSRPAEPVSLPQYRFEVSGTNRTRQVPVVFAGTFMPVDNALTAQGARRADSVQADRVARRQSRGMPRSLCLAAGSGGSKGLRSLRGRTQSR
jgi:hypothetical protein